MLIHKQIIKDTKEARKNANRGRELKDKSSVLVSLLGDLNTRAKDLKVDTLPDEESFKVLRYWSKQMVKLTEVPNIESEVAKNALKSKELYDSYLPKLMTKDEMLAIIKVHKFNNIGVMMKFFKEYHKDTYSPAELSQLYKEWSNVQS